ncbi:hypothetical protein OD350_28530 (plasmid) [Clostridium beijerinckii]|uniref:hypothetical protein n=1 Tax=Clostridium beijerinckii TaxID=1520 RepID=UPI002227C1A3|nr:hypothetical protein [Clostridium beijerinckii]UYZ39021.1 hypothetical protein OD350_28530 [Clostridium beijerinckii]
MLEIKPDSKKLFFDNYYEFYKWLLHSNLDSDTFTGASKKYQEYDWCIARNMSCYVLRDEKINLSNKIKIKIVTIQL